jgi:hypothetical protein
LRAPNSSKSIYTVAAKSALKTWEFGELGFLIDRLGPGWEVTDPDDVNPVLG